MNFTCKISKIKKKERGEKAERQEIIVTTPK
jgi:hypothetical protein